MGTRSTLGAFGLACVLATHVAGCGAASSARTADAIANALAPCGSNAGGVGTLTAPAALVLAAAGASSSSARCPNVPGGTGAAIGPPVLGGIPSVTPTRGVDPPAHTDLSLPMPGRFDCSTMDGDSDVIVAESLVAATDVCRELTGERCECADH